MELSEEERERLGDIVRLQPTKNKELQERWDVDSGSEVHQYLENHLKEYYYRDENSYICATAEAADLLGIETSTEDDDGNPSILRVPELEAQAFAVVAGPDDRSESVVSVLNKIRAEFDVDPEAGDVRRALQSLRRKGVVEVIYRTVPTFKLLVERDSVDVKVV
ncbi:DUF5797 family protein [Salinirubrum litoreum]|uniref:DUF5797 family protein n=1 Tax=Salinirubrum litoreum TaxID=1126234 RepID=A0ABD5R6I5_9EURY|nr:DUF5797 family protein [Salinirubrum litoreum]